MELFDAVLNRMPRSGVSTISEHANMLASCSHDGSISSISVSHAISVAALYRDGESRVSSVRLLPTFDGRRDINHAAKDLFLDLLDQAQQGRRISDRALHGPMAVGKK